MVLAMADIPKKSFLPRRPKSKEEPKTVEKVRAKKDRKASLKTRGQDRLNLVIDAKLKSDSQKYADDNNRSLTQIIVDHLEWLRAGGKHKTRIGVIMSDDLFSWLWDYATRHDMSPEQALIQFSVEHRKKEEGLGVDQI